MKKDLEQKIFEYRGVADLYIAKIIQDDAEEYTCTEPIHLAPVAEVGKSTDSSSEAHYYDNMPMIVINSESSDEIKIVVAPPELERLAYITGKSFDPDTGMMVDGERQNDYYAIMYKAKGTDGEYRYVSRLKGTLGIPEESNQTEDDGTDTTNTELTFTGIYTTHLFDKGKYNEKDKKWEKGAAKGVVVDTRYGKADVSTWFDQIQTPDTVKSKETTVTTE